MENTKITYVNEGKKGVTQRLREDISMLALFDAESLWYRFRGSIIEDKIYAHERSDLWAGFLLSAHFDSLLKYQTSWDWQVPIWQKLNTLVRESVIKENLCNEELLLCYFKLQGTWQGAMLKGDKELAFSTTIAAVNWYLEIKGKQK